MPGQHDTVWMARALFHAERGRGRTHPNPLVGAVVVSDAGVVVGQGAHLQAGGPHAEMWALDAAGELARGATLYCTLEPCCHVGRTGPCVERIAASGIRRVVTAIEDPNPRVKGGGHAWLRAHGIEVETGVGRAEAALQNAPFFTWMQQHRPWTMLKTATSNDGFVGRPHERTTLSGDIANRWMHRQRAWVDAIVVGADTVIADNPSLTARGAFRARPLTRVVVDWRGRTSQEATVWSTPSAGPVIMVVLQSVVDESPHRFAEMRRCGIRVDAYETRDLAKVTERLAVEGVQSVVLEGGPTLQRAWVDAGLVDYVQWLRTPVTLGQGVPMVEAVATRFGAAMHHHKETVLGDDRLVEGSWI
jgi:diaminohydroxyphosphoribosylaminopyrimidine deaminase/5-amino-6-(5-phosphoribosylamino)uracil reductase